ncbi:unnamed protein product, partial [marine sediment metagenome]
RETAAIDARLYTKISTNLLSDCPAITEATAKAEVA